MGNQARLLAHPPRQAPGPRPLLFISDLHLSPAVPRTVAAFEAFIANPPHNPQAIYILGDLFDYWIGDDMLDMPFAQRIAAPLHSLRERGIALYLMPGNRDFLLGLRFARTAGATLLADPFTLNSFGQQIVLTHGDTLCTDDRAYQRFRRLARHPLSQRFFLSWPLRWRQRIAQRIRRVSQAAATTQMAVSDVTPAAVNALFAIGQANLMIHGHTHRPARHDCADGKTRWVLPDWEFDQAIPRGGYLALDYSGLAINGLALKTWANHRPADPPTLCRLFNSAWQKSFDKWL